MLVERKPFLIPAHPSAPMNIPTFAVGAVGALRTAEIRLVTRPNDRLPVEQLDVVGMFCFAEILNSWPRVVAVRGGERGRASWADLFEAQLGHWHIRLSCPSRVWSDLKAANQSNLAVGREAIR